MQPMLYEIITTRDSEGRRVVRSRGAPVNSEDPTFSQMMQIPPRARPVYARSNNFVLPNVQDARFQAFQQMLDTLAAAMAGGPQFGQMLAEDEPAAGANGPGNTAPPPRDPLANSVDALMCVVDTIMEIYPNLGDGNNAQNLTQEQNDIIMNALTNARLPASRRLRNVVLREIILRTRVKTTVSEDAINELQTMKYSELDEQHRERHDKCSICLSEFEKTDTVRLLKCEHFFHQDCIDPYLKNYNNKCPMCRDEH